MGQVGYSYDKFPSLGRIDEWRNEFVVWWGLSPVCVTRTEISRSRSVEKYRRRQGHPSFLLDWFTCCYIISGATDRPHDVTSGFGAHPSKWWPGCSLLCSGVNLFWKNEKKISVFSFSAPCGRARSYSKEQQPNHFFFAKTIKTVVAGSFVPQEKESPRFFTLEEF